MKMQVVIQLIIATLLIGVTQGAVYVRYNAAGYFPTEEKRFVVMSDEDMNGKAWTLKDGSATVAEGTFGQKKVGKGYYSPFAYNYSALFSSVNTEGTYSLEVEGADPVTIKISKSPYNSLIQSTLRWLRVQRSGSEETLDHKVSHLGDSATFLYHRGSTNKEWIEDKDGRVVDLQGGWYADGSYSKFTSAIAYTTYYLLQSYEANPALFVKKYSQSNLIDVLDEAKFGLSYLLKVMPDDTTFILQVGGFDSDFGTRLPENDQQEGKRPSYAALSQPQMATTAAALALGAKVFQNIDADAADRYKAEALKIYAAAQKNHPIAWLERDYALFQDSSKYDNLLLAAATLYELTGDEQYKKDASTYSLKAKNAYWASWATQNMMAQSLIAQENPKAKRYLEEDLNMFNAEHNKKANLWKMPVEWGFSALYTSNIAGAAAARYGILFQSDRYKSLLLDVLNFGFGINNWGVSFTGSKELPNAVKNFNMAIYKLQTRLYAEGAIVIGPSDTPTHDAESKWILDDIRVNYCYPFNTPSSRYLDHADDYMTNDAWIYGAADNLYLLTLATTLLSK